MARSRRSAGDPAGDVTPSAAPGSPLQVAAIKTPPAEVLRPRKTESWRVGLGRALPPVSAGIDALSPEAAWQLPPPLLASESTGFRVGQEGDPEVQSLKYLGVNRVYWS